MRFLRTRLFLATFGVTTLILFGAGVLLYILLRSSVYAEFDESLLARAQSLASLVEQDGDRIEFEFDATQMPEYADPDRPEYFQIWASDGTPIGKSPSLGQHGLERGREEGPSYRLVELPEAGTVRLLTTALPMRGEHTDEQAENDESSDGQAARGVLRVTLSVAKDTRDIERTLSGMRWLLVLVLVGASLVSAGTMMVVLRHGLKPVSTLAETISRIDDRDLSERIDLPDSVGELVPVVDRLNEMLARLEQAVQREKAFTANVAHELRTPLAGLETALEVCASKPRQETEYQQVVLRCLDTAQAMRGMVNNLLILGRVDAGQLSLDRESIDFDAFVTECWEPFRERAAERGLTVDFDNRIGVDQLTTDQEKLRIVLYNLFDNAVRHAEAGGQISVSIDQASDELAFEIRNSGCTIDPADVDRVFDRFWKNDEPRSEGAKHCGLGLPLARQMVEVLGGAISVTIAPGQTFIVRLALPMRG
jgi:two-component system heavy metal sensor histidine kinase CusS